MKLTVLERLSLLTILPPEGTLATLRIVRKLRETLSFSEAELVAFSVITEGNQIKWDSTKEPPAGVEVEVGEKATDLVVETLKKLDQAGKVTDGHLSLFEKFVPQT